MPRRAEAARTGLAHRPFNLALEAATAVREYQQLSPLMPPGTLVGYTVHVTPVADFRAGFDAEHWSALWADFDCHWRELWFNQRVEPPSWALADEVRAAGARGIVFASQLAPGGVSVVLCNDMLGAEDSLLVHDPAGALPKNRDSWR